MDKKSQTNFYKDLDEYQTHVSNGCLKVGIFFFILFLIGAIFVYFGINRIKNNVKDINTDSFDIKTNLSSPDQFSKQESLIILNQDINEMLDLNQKKLPIKYLMSDITQDNIILKGIWEATSARIEIVLLPCVKNNNVVVKTQSVKIGRFNAPSWFAGNVSNLINTEIHNRAEVMSSLKVSSVELQQDQMLIKFTR